MKSEMRMLDNGNYESVVLPLQHSCRQDTMACFQYSRDMENLHLIIEEGDPYEDGFSLEFIVKYCPICGHEAKKCK